MAEAMDPAGKRIIDILDDKRIEDFTHRLQVTPKDSIVYDLSKTHLTERAVEKYRSALEQKGLDDKIEQMWTGEPINYTEKIPVLHYLLRDPGILDRVESYANSFNKLKDPAEAINSQTHINVVGGPMEDHEAAKEAALENKNVVSVGEDATKKLKTNRLDAERDEIFNELIKIHDFCQEFESMHGITNKQLDTIVSIGIGGSDLGPKMVTDALQYYAQNRSVYYVSNIDSTNMLQVFDKIDVEKTLFVIVSKTFTTAETIENFRLAMLLFKERIAEKGGSGDDLEMKIGGTHFVAVSSNTGEAAKYGITRVFKMWDFVGGRYSLWSTVGLSIALYVGFRNFLRLLRGAAVADADFRSNGINSISARMAVNELYYADNGYNNKCVVCYDGYLRYMYPYLQQAEMESNGKRGSKQMIIWGGVGTDVQHSFFQLLHQGEQKILTEFLLPINNLRLTSPAKAEGHYRLTPASFGMVEHHHRLLIANCLAQSRSLMVGKQADEACRVIDGDKPSVTILYTKLSPEVLGAIVGVYEHKIFTVGVFYGINSFDQFGVQLGKEVAIDLMKEFETGGKKTDKSTDFLIRTIKE